MRSSMFSLAVLFATSFAALGQSSKQDSPPVRIERPLARLSYRSTYGVDAGNQQKIRSICFMLEENGHYRLAKSTWMMKSGTEISQGVLSPYEMSRVSSMLKNLEDIKPTTGGWVQQGVEGFVALIQQDARSTHLRWTDPDHTRPFPTSISRIVDWLQDFNPQEASSSFIRDMPDPSICPAWSEPLQPGIAKLEQDISPNPCWFY